MATQTKFASPEIAKEMAKVFRSEAKVVSVTIKSEHKKAVGDFVQKIEKAHKKAAKSTLVFG